MAAKLINLPSMQRLFVAGAMAAFCIPESVFAQSSATPLSSQLPAVSASPGGNPTKPEVQPRLDVDRDPIPSPDPEEVPPVPNATATSTPAKSGEIRKDQSGIYTLHADVDEVLLNCSVIDEKGRTVTDLNQKNFQVWEDGVPQTVNSAIHQDLPVSMGILQTRKMQLSL
jgi:Ca-activated chloride channel homolog